MSTKTFYAIHFVSIDPKTTRLRITKGHSKATLLAFDIDRDLNIVSEHTASERLLLETAMRTYKTFAERKAPKSAFYNEHDPKNPVSLAFTHESPVSDQERQRLSI